MLHETSSNEVSSLMVNFLARKHILLLHAGGDSKRVPWANPMGKVFLPLPYLAEDDPDGPVPLLFDHILAISSCARQAFKNEGYLNFLFHLSRTWLYLTVITVRIGFLSPSTLRLTISSDMFICLLKKL